VVVVFELMPNGQDEDDTNRNLVQDHVPGGAKGDDQLSARETRTCLAKEVGSPCQLHLASQLNLIYCSVGEAQLLDRFRTTQEVLMESLEIGTSRLCEDDLKSHQRV